jgi:hypothetical protein
MCTPKLDVVPPYQCMRKTAVRTLTKSFIRAGLLEEVGRLVGTGIAFLPPFARSWAGEIGGNLQWRRQMNRITLSSTMCTM